MDASTLVNIAMTLGGLVVTVLNAWILMLVKNTRGDIGRLQAADTALTAQIAAVRELVAGQYITRAEFSAALDRQTTTILAALTGLLGKQKE